MFEGNVGVESYGTEQILFKGYFGKEDQWIYKAAGSHQPARTRGQ